MRLRHKQHLRRQVQIHLYRLWDLELGLVLEALTLAALELDSLDLDQGQPWEIPLWHPGP